MFPAGPAHQEPDAALIAARNPDALDRLIAENTLDIVLQFDRDGRILYASPSCRAAGYAPEEMIGHLGAAFIHPDEVERLLANTRDLADGFNDPTRNRRYRVRMKNGGYRWYEGNPSLTFDATGAVAGSVNIIRDVHDSVLAAEVLAESEARYRLLAEHMSDIVVQLDVDGSIRYVSPSVRALGYTPDELIGQDRSKFIHADEVPRLLDNMAHLRSGVLDRKRDRTHRIRLKDGGFRWFDGAPSPIHDENGAVIGVVNVLRDIHDAKAAEEDLAASEARFRLLADNMGDIVSCYGADGVLTFVSGATQATLGYAPEELIGRNVDALIHPDDLKAAHALYERKRSEGPGVAPFLCQYRMTRKDGSVVWLEAHPRGRFAADGSFVEWQDVVRDIDAHKRLEEDLRTARRAADAATQTKADFLADMSHELRGPLTSIASFARLGRDHPATPLPVRTGLEQIERASVDLVAMVNDILDFSKLEAAQVVFRPNPVAFDELVKGVVDLLHPQAMAKDVPIILANGTQPGRMLSLDAGRVRQVLLNLLGNAVKFTHSGRITVEIEYDTATSRLSVDVRDTGSGIAEERLVDLFDRFTKASDDAGVRTYGGAGLGLAISKAIVEGMGGQISVESKVGRGSCFSFWIPAAPAGDRVEEDEEPASKLRILVAHGDAAVRALVEDSLSNLKVEVVTARDGPAAFKLPARERVDVILTDLALARGQRAALRSLGRPRGGFARTPVLALSADASDALHAQVLGEGFQGLLATPCTPSELTSAIAHVLAVEVGLASPVHS
ncbi:MAG TPA: PAS domain S-box protein [Phenylobacterium sp.]